MHRLKALYFGTPDFSADFLKKVLDDKDILVKIDGVVTQNVKKFKYGIWVIHPSLLPKYRGASPIAQTLINGDTETGVTIIQADEGVDTGDILGQIITKIKPNENRNELTIRLSNLGYDLFKETIN